jgi:hypothetical protein
MSKSIGNVFRTLVPTFDDDASIEEAFSLYHYGKEDYSEGQEIPANSIEGNFVTVNSRVQSLESVVDNLGQTYVLKQSLTLNPNVVTTQDGGTTIPLVIRGVSAQTQPLQQWQNSVSSPISSLHANGGASFANYVSVGDVSQVTTTALNIKIGNAAHKGLVVAGASSQTENLQEWTSISGSTTSIVARVNSAGKIFSNNGLTGTSTSEVVTETGTQTLTNKTLNSATLTNASLSGTVTMTSGSISGATSITLTGNQVLTSTVRNIVASTSNPSGGNDGDVWFKY